MPRRPSRRSHRRRRQIALSLWGLAALALFVAALATLPGDPSRKGAAAVAAIGTGGDDHAPDRLMPLASSPPPVATLASPMMVLTLLVLASSVLLEQVQVFIARLRGPPRSVFVLHA